MEDFYKEVEETVEMILRHPNIGQIDPLFANRTKTYLGVIINGLSKLVYFVSDDILYIAGFWDTRMEPQRQVSQVK